MMIIYVDAHGSRPCSEPVASHHQLLVRSDSIVSSWRAYGGIGLLTAFEAGLPRQVARRAELSWLHYSGPSARRRAAGMYFELSLDLLDCLHAIGRCSCPKLITPLLPQYLSARPSHLPSASPSHRQSVSVIPSFRPACSLLHSMKKSQCSCRRTRSDHCPNLYIQMKCTYAKSVGRNSRPSSRSSHSVRRCLSLLSVPVTFAHPKYPKTPSTSPKRSVQ